MGLVRRVINAGKKNDPNSQKTINKDTERYASPLAPSRNATQILFMCVLLKKWFPSFYNTIIWSVLFFFVILLYNFFVISLFHLPILQSSLKLIESNLKTGTFVSCDETVLQKKKNFITISSNCKWRH